MREVKSRSPGGGRKRAREKCTTIKRLRNPWTDRVLYIRPDSALTGQLLDGERYWGLPSDSGSSLMSREQPIKLGMLSPKGYEPEYY
ncbi:MAG: hypothetical protein HY296_00480 [Thaumarchaeota archaeon]|nr:hypothetical protein [Nitrososphaerota archaeon]